MAASTYHVTSKEVENHILKHDWLITHLCMHKQPTLTKQWKCFCANISYIVISDTLVASFLDVFVLTLGLIFSEFHVNLGSKDSVSEKRNRICVSDETFLTARHPFCVILCCCLRLLPSPSQVTYLLNGCMVMFYVMISWVNGQKYENLLQFIIQYIILDFVLASVVLAMTLTKKSNILSCYSFLHKLLLITKITNSLLVTVMAQWTAKTTNSEKAI